MSKILPKWEIKWQLKSDLINEERTIKECNTSVKQTGIEKKENHVYNKHEINFMPLAAITDMSNKLNLNFERGK